MNKEFDEIDELLFNYFENNQDVPEIISNGIDSALIGANQTSIKEKISRIIITIISLISIVGGVVFAKNIVNFIYQFFNTSRGIDTAIQNDYIEFTDMEHISSNNVESKVDNLLMDDYNLSFTLSIKFDNLIKVNEIDEITLPDLLIHDENNCILYCNNKEKFNKYCKENQLNYEFMSFNDGYINSGFNCYVKSKNEEENTIEFICNIFGDSYPKSKTINLNFSRIDISNLSKDENYLNKCIDGDWNINIEVPEIFYNRDSYIYRVKSCSDESIKVTEAIVNNTCMTIKLETQEDPVFMNTDSEEVKKQKIEDWINNLKQSSSTMEINLFGDNPYVETDNKIKYYPTKSGYDDSVLSRNFNGNVAYWQTFELTKFDATKTLKVFINYKQKDVEIILERN